MRDTLYINWHVPKLFSSLTVFIWNVCVFEGFICKGNAFLCTWQCIFFQIFPYVCVCLTVIMRCKMFPSGRLQWTPTNSFRSVCCTTPLTIHFQLLIQYESFLARTRRSKVSHKMNLILSPTLIKYIWYLILNS